MTYQLGSTYYFSFAVVDAASIGVNADVTPAITVERNGTADGAVTPTVTNPATGRYKVSVTIPGGYAQGDTVELIGSATVGGEVVPFVLASIIVGSAFATDASGNALAKNSDATAIKAKTDNLPSSPAAVGSPMTLATDAVNAAAISADAVAEMQDGLARNYVIAGTVDTGSFSPTATAFEAGDITEATADHYNGRSIIFTSGALTGQATSITDYEKVGANGRFTVVSMTEAPGNNDTFIIV